MIIDETPTITHYRHRATDSQKNPLPDKIRKKKKKEKKKKQKKKGKKKKLEVLRYTQATGIYHRY